MTGPLALVGPTLDQARDVDPVALIGALVTGGTVAALSLALAAWRRRRDRRNNEQEPTP